MSIVGGLDVHRRQITYDYLDVDSGEEWRGEIRPATRDAFRQWLSRLDGHVGAFALEGTTGWLYVVDELSRAGFDAHVGEPADTRVLRGRKKRAKTDRADARHLRNLLVQGTLPESWVPPAHIVEWRTQLRLRKALVDDRTAWIQRIRAQLFHHGLPDASKLTTAAGRMMLDTASLPAAARQVIDVAVRSIDRLEDEIAPLDAQLAELSRQQAGCVALRRHYGVGPITSVAILAELGDTRRFSSSRQAVRFAGLDVTVWESDAHRSRGRLSRQGPPLLRWALYEAAKSAARPTSPDHDYYVELRQRLGAKRATVSVGRLLVRRAHHTLRELGDAAYTPVS